MTETSKNQNNSHKHYIAQYEAIAQGRPPLGDSRNSNSAEPKHAVSALKVQTIRSRDPKLNIQGIDEAEDVDFVKFLEQQVELYKNQPGYQKYRGYQQREGKIRDREDRDETPSSQSFIQTHRYYTDNYPYLPQPGTNHIVQQYAEDQLAQQEDSMDDQESFNKFHKEQYDQHQYLWQPPKADKQPNQSSQLCQKKGVDVINNKQIIFWQPAQRVSVDAHDQYNSILILF